MESKAIARKETREGWTCLKCGRFYTSSQQDLDMKAAMSCCHPVICDCGQPCERPRLKCPACLEAAAVAHHAKREVREQGDTPVIYSEELNRYFSDVEAFEDHCEAYEIDLKPEDARLLVCKGEKPGPFEFETWQEDLLRGEDGEMIDPPEGYDEIEDVVNGWIEKSEPWSWWPTEYALRL